MRVSAQPAALRTLAGGHMSPRFAVACDLGATWPARTGSAELAEEGFHAGKSWGINGSRHGLGADGRLVRLDEPKVQREVV